MEDSVLMSTTAKYPLFNTLTNTSVSVHWVSPAPTVHCHQVIIRVHFIHLARKAKMVKYSHVNVRTHTLFIYIFFLTPFLTHLKIS